MNNSVELLGYYGSDEIIACSAWTSTNRDLTNEKKGRICKLIDMLWNSGHECYDENTEILTKLGWKLFKNLSDTDYVCAVNISNRTCKFEKPSRRVSYDYNDNMYYVSGQQLDLMVTKKHNMVVSKPYGKNKHKFRFKTVEEISGDTVAYLKAAQITNTENIYENPNFAKLIGFFVGDGHAGTTNRIEFHLRLKRKINYLYSLGFPITKLSNDNYVIKQKNIGLWFKSNCYLNKEKKLPDNYMDYSYQDSMAVLEGLKNSDGSIKRKTWVYSTTSVVLKEQLQILACLNNFCFTVSKLDRSEHSNWKDVFRLNYSNRICPEVINYPSRKNKTVDRWIHYCGKVYCVTVSTGAIIVRRNGKICVSGNTPFEKGVVHFLVNTDIASHIHLLKHRISSLNGESARYKELKEDKYYIPSDWKDIRSSGEGFFDGERIMVKGERWSQVLENYVNCGNELYHECIKDLVPALGKKRAKESARFFKTYNNQIQADVMFNIRSFANFLKLRCHDTAQLEIRKIAHTMLYFVENIDNNPFKFTLEAVGIKSDKNLVID